MCQIFDEASIFIHLSVGAIFGIGFKILDFCFKIFVKALPTPENEIRC